MLSPVDVRQVAKLTFCVNVQWQCCKFDGGLYLSDLPCHSMEEPALHQGSNDTKQGRGMTHLLDLLCCKLCAPKKKSFSDLVFRSPNTIWNLGSRFFSGVWNYLGYFWRGFSAKKIHQNCREPSFTLLSKLQGNRIKEVKPLNKGLPAILLHCFCAFSRTKKTVPKHTRVAKHTRITTGENPHEAKQSQQAQKNQYQTRVS